MYRRLHGGLRGVVRCDTGYGSRFSANNLLHPGKFCLSNYRATFHLFFFFSFFFYIQKLLSIECLAISRWPLCMVGKIRHIVFIGNH